VLTLDLTTCLQLPRFADAKIVWTRAHGVWPFLSGSHCGTPPCTRGTRPVRVAKNSSAVHRRATVVG